MSAPPPCADTGGPGARVPGRWLGVNTRIEDRRKEHSFTLNTLPGVAYWGGTSYFFHDFSRCWENNRRSGKERRVALTGLDDESVPLCGDPGCGGCPTLRDLAAWNREQYRQANIALGLPEDFHLPDTDEQHDDEAERWYEGHYPSGVSDPADTVTYGIEGCTGCGP